MVTDSTISKLVQSGIALCNARWEGDITHPEAIERMTNLVREAVAEVPTSAQVSISEQPMIMALCEAESVVLREGQLYKFTPVGDCERCQRLSQRSNKAYGDPPPDNQDLKVIHASFECSGNNFTGSTSVPVKRVDQNDDGSITVVIDYWPEVTKPAAQSKPVVDTVYTKDGWQWLDESAGLRGAYRTRELAEEAGRIAGAKFNGTHYGQLVEAHILEYPGDVFVVFDPLDGGSGILGAARTRQEAVMLRDQWVEAMG